MHDQPLKFHKSFNDLLDTFRNVLVSTVWLKVSIEQAENYFKPFPYVITLPCSVSNQEIKVDKSILKFVKAEGFNKKTPLFSQTLANFYRVFTIAVKDIIWGEKDFEKLLKNEELQFLQHLRNASAHNNNFYWGEGVSREKTLLRLPVSWRGKQIEEKLENTLVYMDFMKPGDIFILLSDISNLADLSASVGPREKC